MGKRSAEEVSDSFWAIVTSPRARKFQVVVLGIILSAATMGLLPAPVAIWVILIVNSLTAAGVFVVPNAGKPVQPEVAKAFDRGDVVG